ncbi:hypothetical protein GOP47_0015605 [Adiantum capillus-veneris]|uniref:PPPDE domain-containing protein n=1 Tax=Adiantum capillus-veneris TaxID=13818 RepID=A0A9D4UK03_ADICA|nr:hypothetical protein GOP47_0015605 [Adiantum capillus-veneris]
MCGFSLSCGLQYSLTKLDLDFASYPSWLGAVLLHCFWLPSCSYGIEYAYGAHDYASTGVFEVEPRQCPGFKFRKSITLGTVGMGPQRFREFVEEIANAYSGDSYHLLFKNCNHFCDDVCMRLISSHLPPWINRLAKLGALCRCFVPDVLQPEGIKALDYEICDGDDTKSDEFVLLCNSHDVRSDRFDEDISAKSSSTDIPKYIPCGQCSP